MLQFVPPRQQRYVCHRLVICCSKSLGLLPVAGAGAAEKAQHYRGGAGDCALQRRIPHHTHPLQPALPQDPGWSGPGWCPLRLLLRDVPPSQTPWPWSLDSHNTACDNNRSFLIRKQAFGRSFHGSAHCLMVCSSLRRGRPGAADGGI